MLGLFYCVADVDRLVGMDMLEIGSHIEGDGIDHAAGAVIFKFKLDMLKIFAYKFACAEIKDVARHENRLLVARTIRIELLEIYKQFGCDVCKFYFSVDVYLRRQLVGLYMLGYILLEAAAEFRYVLLFERQSYSVSMAAEILQKVARSIHSSINVESLHRA